MTPASDPRDPRQPPGRSQRDARFRGGRDGRMRPDGTDGRARTDGTEGRARPDGTAGRAGRGRNLRPGRQRATHSMEAVLTEAVALLDEAGEPALTFRALAARLGTGVGSIYWYVASKDDLLDRASDHVMDDVLHQTEQVLSRSASAGDPIDDLRALGNALFDAVVVRPWLGAYFMRSPLAQPNSMRFYERLGQQVLRLNLTPRQAFHGASAIIGFVIGSAIDLGQTPPKEVMAGEVSRDEYMSRIVDEWRAENPADFPFLHTILDEFDGHDDADQFRAGLDLLLDGLRLQAGR